MNVVIPFETVTSVFTPNYNTTQDVVVNEGGSSSSKTYSILQVLSILAIQNNNSVTTIVGQDIPNLKSGSLRDFIDIWQNSEFLKWAIVNYNRSERIFRFGNGSIIEFKSYDDWQDAKNGKRDFLFLNEANGISYQIAIQLMMRTKIRTYIDYNPDASFWVHDRILSDKNANVRYIHSTYRNNPYCPNRIINELESYKEKDPNKWRVYGEGLLGRIEGVVYDNWKMCSEFPNECKWVAYGLDFGYANDPTALVKVGYFNGEIWVDEMIYETGLTNQDISYKLKGLDVEYNLEIIADSSEPKSIEEIRREGFFIKPCTKGSDSIRSGIDMVRGHSVNYTINSQNLSKELSNYKWKENKDGNFINSPIDNWNHALDAVRYVVQYKFTKTEPIVIL